MLTQDLSIAAGLLVILLISLEFGFRAGRRAVEEGDTRSSGQIGAIQGAVLGLLGLLLAFSFAAAASRFLERQDLIVQEANAIGTAYLRADLLDDVHKSQLKAALKRYTEHRIEASARIAGNLDAADVAEVRRLHTIIWNAARDGVAVRPETMLGVLPPVNDVLDLHSTRVAAGKKHLPSLVMGLLLASSVLSMGVIGYGAGLGKRRRAPLTDSLALIIGASLWITYDLDHPRSGLLRLSDAPLTELSFDSAAK